MIFRASLLLVSIFSIINFFYKICIKKKTSNFRVIYNYNINKVKAISINVQLPDGELK